MDTVWPMETTPWLSGALAFDIWAAGRGAACALQWRQGTRLRRLLDVALRLSAVHRPAAGDPPRRTTTLDGWPVTRKPALMARFADWVTDPALRLDIVRAFASDPAFIGQPLLGRYTVWGSSGSSGTPGLFVQDEHAMAVHDTLEALRRPAPWRLDRTPPRIVFVGATGAHFASVVSLLRMRSRYPWLSGRIATVSFLQPLGDLLAELRRAAPQVLATYPSVALLLAQAQAAGRLRLQLDEVCTGGETLTPAVRRFVAEVFGCPVHDSYGASEFFTLAAECGHGRLHLNADWCLLEPVDAAGRPVAPGEASHSVWLTNLANHVQPLIRYDLGDSVRMATQACACGSCLPVIEVMGRRDDTLLVPGRDHARVALLPLALSTVVEEQGGLYDFQLRQEQDGDLTLSTPQRGDEALRRLRRAADALRSFAQAQGACGLHLRCRSGCPPLLGPSGKAARILKGPAAAAMPATLPKPGRAPSPARVGARA